VRKVGAAVCALPLLALLTGCTPPTDNGVTFLAETSALCAAPDLESAVIGVGIEVHGSSTASLHSVVLGNDGTTIDAQVWLLDAFPANQSAGDPSTVAGWQTRTDVDGSQVSPGSHTLVVELDRSDTGAATVVTDLAVTYTVDGRTGTATSDVVLGFGTPDHASCS
jgi:hypothetical protein